MMKRYCNIIVSALIILTLGTACTAKADNAKLTEDQKLSVITKLASRLIAKNHYRQHPLDNKISSKLFDEYFKLLDPSKIYFTQEDIKKFEKYRYYLDDLARMGNNDFAFEVYKLYLLRLEDYRKFAEKELKKGFDFTKKESFSIDRSKLPRCADMKELKKVWRKKLKNDLLYFKLMKRALLDEAKDHKGKKESEKDKAREKKLAALKKIWDKRTPEEKILKRLRDINNEMSQKDKIDILRFYLTALALTYGPHSGYLSPKDQEDFDINMKLSLVGIGAVLTSDDGYTKVVKIIPGGPAAKDGKLKPEDRIIAVTQDNGETTDIIDMSISKVVELIRGKKGTKVTLTILPGSKGRNAVPVNITLVRDKVALKSSEATGKVYETKDRFGNKMKVGVITLPRFYMDFKAAFSGDPNFKSSSRDVAKILDKFQKDKVDGVVVDLRYNGGGSLREAINLTGLFIGKGPIVQVRQSDRSVSVKYDPDSIIHYKGPLVVLMNKLTSSAAEIFTGAIKDYQRGIIVGDSRTYGKGTVLDVIDLNRLLRYINQDFPAGTVKFESAVFYRVNGASTQQLGVVPDIKLPSFTEYMEIGELYNDNHLPWDAINEVPHDFYDKKISSEIKTVKEWSKERLSKSPEYKVLLKNLKMFNKYKKRKEISLNEKERWGEYLQEKKMRDANEKYLSQLTDTADDDKKDKDKDFYLNEAIHILTDYIDVKKNKKPTSKAKVAAITKMKKEPVAVKH
ncbi:carboxy terminal-processing peptidase [Lentisphaerota bacterium ZTH]|nr:carboxy terminal-processing peptidase [Lentisphaerota bacterium]WET07043.1 carboxy terminal-processing peptidase [Lentisphaerota bacterium ZTH]